MSKRMTPPTARATLLMVFWAGCSGVGHVMQAQTPPGALQSLTVGGTPDRVVIELTATLPIAGQIQTLGEPADRLFVDLSNVLPQVPETTDVNLGAVKRVRVGLNRSTPPVTRVVLDVDGASFYQVEPGATPRELRITIETDAVRPAVETGTYMAWFTRTTVALKHLLATAAERSAQVNVQGLVGPELGLEWDALRHHLSAVTPPPGLAAAHELLVTAHAIGHAGIAQPGAVFSAADVQSATAGASMMVRRAERLAAPHLTLEPTAP